MRIIRALTVGLAAVLVGTLGVSGVTYALWSSQATASSSVAAGSVGVTIAGGGSLTVTYAAATLVKSGELVVSNSGTVASNYSTAVALGAGSSSVLANTVQVAVWPKSGTCPVTAPTTAVTGTWASVPAISGSLAAGAAATWCVRTSVTAAQVTANPNTQVSPTFTATAAVGSWTATSATSATQNIAAPVAATLACAVSGVGVIVSWSEASGTPYTLYQVWIGGVRFANGNSNDRTEYIGWSDIVPDHGASGTPALVEIKKVTNTGVVVSVVASGYVTPTMIAYSNYNQNVVQCG